MKTRVLSFFSYCLLIQRELEGYFSGATSVNCSEFEQNRYEYESPLVPAQPYFNSPQPNQEQSSSVRAKTFIDVTMS